MKKNKTKISDFYRQNGFSLLELLIVVALLVSLAALSAPLYGNYYNQEQLEIAAADIKEALTLSRVRAKTAHRSASYGVYLDFDKENQSLISYSGESYFSRDSQYDEVIELPNTVVASSSFSNNDINFSSFSGKPSQSGGIELQQRINNRTVYISLNSLGLVNAE